MPYLLSLPASRLHPFGSGIALSSGLCIPPAFRRLAFASRSILSRCGVTFLTVRLRCAATPTASGFPRSARTRCVRGGCPLSAGVVVSMILLATREVSTRTRNQRKEYRDPLPPSLSANIRWSDFTTDHRGFISIHPSGLSLACRLPVGLALPWAFTSRFRPRRYQRRTERWEQALDTRLSRSVRCSSYLY